MSARGVETMEGGGVRVEGYEYDVFLERVRRRWPRMACWVCERLLPCVLPQGALAGEVRRCREQSMVIDAHHLCPKSKLKREFPHGAVYAVDLDPSTGAPVLDESRIGWRPFDPRLAYCVLPGALLPRSLGEILMDDRNGVPVRRFHHDALEARLLAGRPLDVPRGMLPPAVFEFAVELGLVPLLEKVYPKETLTL